MRIARLTLLHAALLVSSVSGATRQGISHGRIIRRNETSSDGSSTSIIVESSIETISVSTPSYHSPGQANSTVVSPDPSTTASTYSSTTFSTCDDTRNCTQSWWETIQPPPATGSGGPVPTPCIPLPSDGKPVTEFLVVYTSTTTLGGSSTDYTPPHETIDVPTYCPPDSLPFPSFPVTASLPYPSFPTNSKLPGDYTPKLSSTRWSGTWSTPLPKPFPSGTTVTFVTTDKNPSVLWPSQDAPDYDPTWLDRETPAGQPTFIVTARPDNVIINDSTVPVRPSRTTTVEVDDGTFTINPTEVVGEGVTVTKPAPSGAEPTTTTVSGLPVEVAGTEAVIDGTTVSIPAGGTTTIIDGITISADPDSLIVGDSTLEITQPPQETKLVIAGGDMLTVHPSSVVLDGTTWTYGANTPATTTTIDEDILTIGPLGVTVRDTTLDSDDREIVGGATLTEVGSSLVVINGTTFTVGPGAGETTTTFAGETITIGPDGVRVETLTREYPFGASVVTTFGPSGTGRGNLAIETAAEADDDEDDAGMALRPGMVIAGVGLLVGFLGVLL